ncbi:unnamed protein product [Allacma fusca]|uniref:HTH CENPB-type domain-containing protein n=1 Tax=Allacma fusca TaxID=39272 RepID=A0A8J2LE36_9HEXA|nr:unnamed protein product [Allacma fusca]
MDERTNVQRKRRNALSVRDKITIIEKMEQGRKQVDVAKEMKIPRQTVQKTWRSREKIRSQFKSKNYDRKKMRTPEYDDIDMSLLEWFKLQRNRGIPLGGSLLLEKAAEFARWFGKTKFQASSGWFTKWKQRHNIAFKTVSGELAQVDLSITLNWIQYVYSTVAQRYEARDIFNADETGLFYKALPDRPFYFKGKTCSGGNHSKDRLTVLLCCNKDGAEKLKPLVIGKYANPRCFAKLKSRESLPVYYYANKKAWMVTTIFSEWLRKINKQVQKRKILLLLDNCSSHPKDIRLSNVELLFLPPNATSVIQPLDQGSNGRD